MARHLWPVLVLLLLVGCGDDDPVVPDPPDPPVLTTNVIESWDYISNRFFRLDLPPHSAAVLRYQPDIPGRQASEQIDRSSIHVYRWVVGKPHSGDLTYAAVVEDTSGRWNENGRIDGLPLSAWEARQFWREVEHDQYVTDTNILIAVDLLQEMGETDLLGVVYSVVDANGTVLYKVGDNPVENAFPGLYIEDNLYYRLKLLKPETRDPYTFQYVLRNIYSLGGTNIDPASFDLRIERNTTQVEAHLHYTGDLYGAPADSNAVDYLRVFGLDTQNAQSAPGADGLVDKHDANRFDLVRGLLKFPLDFPFPFAADREQYEDYANVSLPFPWDDTFLAEQLTPEIYDWITLPSQFPNYAKFRLVVTYDPSPEEPR